MNVHLSKLDAIIRRRQSILVIVALAVAVAVVVATFVFGFVRDAQGPDSWTYYELSKTIFTDFYRSNTRIQYQIDTDYSTSFPPLTPILTRLADLVFDTGVYSGAIVNSIFSLALLILLVWFFQKMRGNIWPGIMAFLTVQTSRAYIEEVQASRAISKGVCLWAALLCLYLMPSKRPVRQCMIMGLIAAAMATNRYDSFMASFLFTVVIYLRERRLSHVLAFLSTHLLAISPWLYYSLHNFGRLMPTEAFRMMVLAFKNEPIDFYLDPQILPSMANYPVAWIMATIERILAGITGLVQLRYLLPMVLLLVFQRRNLSTVKTSVAFSGEEQRRLLYFSALVLLHTVSSILPGVPSTRYFVLELLLGAIVIGLALPRQGLSGASDKRQIWTSFAVVGMGLIAIAQIVTFAFFGPCGANSPCQSTGSTLSPRERQVLTSLQAAGLDKTSVLNLDGNVYTYRFGALTGIHTYISPSNANDCIVTNLIERFDIGVLIVSDNELSDQLNKQFELREIADGVVVVGGRKDGSAFGDQCDSRYAYLL